MALEIRRISASKLIVGGEAILAAIINIHHIAILGVVKSRPFVINNLRVWVFS